MENNETAKRKLERFRNALLKWNKNRTSANRSELNRTIVSAREIVRKARCDKKATISPPPMIGGYVQTIDLFDLVFNAPYDLDFTQDIIDMIDATLGVLDERNIFSEPISKNSSVSQKDSSKKSENVFIVHGRDTELKESTARILSSLGLNPIILHEQANGGKTIIEKFETHSSESGYAIILLTPDDQGCLIGKENKLKKRARQNVVFELGYFIGKLGRNNVSAIIDGEIEIPTDVSGIVYINKDNAGAWKIILGKELKNAGLKVDLNKIPI